MRRRLLLTVLLAGCASAPPHATALPPLRLPPAALAPARWALSQRLSVWRLDEPDAPPQRVEVQLQLDAAGLLLAGFAYGQRLLLMKWDGQALNVQRHAMLPREVDTDRMLRDLSFSFWPDEAVNAALPPGWAWLRTADGQQLQQGGEARLVLRRPAANIVELVNHVERYRLLIESQPLEASP